MKSMLAMAVLTVMGSVVLAGDFSVSQLQQTEAGVQKSRADVQLCMDICILTYDGPGPELKACVAKCAE